MSDANPSGSPLDRITGAAGPDATGAFKLLSNETRLAILIALWEAFEPLAEDNAVPFSDLRERVGTADSGQFNYHLDKPTDHFVRSSASGYELSAAGHKLVRAVLAGSGLGEPTVAPSELDLACNRCGASPVTVSYHDEAVHLTCGSCEGFMATERFPEVLIGHFDFDPAGLSSRDAGEILAGSCIAENLRLRSLLAGICPECSGPIETTPSSVRTTTPVRVGCARPAVGATSPGCGTSVRSASTGTRGPRRPRPSVTRPWSRSTATTG